MDKNIYVVQEVDSDENITSELFNEDRDGAIRFLKTRHATIKQNHKDWEEEVDINYYAWHKDDKFIKLYLKILEDDRTNDE